MQFRELDEAQVSPAKSEQVASIQTRPLMSNVPENAVNTHRGEMRDSSNLEGNWAIFQSKTLYLITCWLNTYEYEYYFITLCVSLSGLNVQTVHFCVLLFWN